MQQTENLPGLGGAVVQVYQGEVRIKQAETRNVFLFERGLEYKNAMRLHCLAPTLQGKLISFPPELVFQRYAEGFSDRASLGFYGKLHIQRYVADDAPLARISSIKNLFERDLIGVRLANLDIGVCVQGLKVGIGQGSEFPCWLNFIGRGR